MSKTNPIFPHQGDLKNKVNEALDFAIKNGATSAEASISVDNGYQIQVRQKELEKVEYHADQSFSITVYRGHQKGNANVSDLSLSAIFDATQKACEIAQFAMEDPCAGLADAELMAKEIKDLDLYHPWNLTVNDAIDLALHCSEHAYQCDPRIDQVEDASISSYQGCYFYGNTHGFLGAIPSTSHGLSCSVIAKDKNGMERDYDYTIAREAASLKNANEIAEEAVRKTVMRLNPRKISSRTCPVIFEANVAREIIGLFLSAISGSSLYRKASFLVDHLGKKIFPDKIDIFEQPHILKGIGSAPFDGDGLETYDKHFVKEGELVSYILGTYSARKLGMKSTANAGGVNNLFISHGNNDLKGLLKRMDRGILVRELLGSGTNLVTGDYSQGIFGFWVENGEIQYPISEMTIAANLKDIFLHLIEVGNDVDHRGNIQTGSLLFESMAVGGQ